MIDRRPGLLAFRRQPKMGADGLRFGNRAGSSIAALKVSAATGPTPGMPQKRRRVVLPSSGSSATNAVTRVSKLARWIRRRHD